MAPTQGSQDQQFILFCLAVILAVLVGSAIGLLSWAGGINVPLAVVAGLTAAGVVFSYAVAVFGLGRQ